MLLLNSDMENELPENLESESLTDELRFLGRLTNLDSFALHDQVLSGVLEE